MNRIPRLIPLVAVVAVVVAAIGASPALAYKVARDPAPPSGTVGTPYSYTFQSKDGVPPSKFTFSSGVLPPGLTIALDGKMSGTPTAGGVYSFYVAGVDSVGNTSQVQFTITIQSKLTVTVGSLPPATVGTPYSFGLTVSGGSASSWTVSAGALPTGISLTNAGVLTGTPTTVGSSTFTVKASDGSRSDTRALTLDVMRPLSVTAATFPPAIVGRPFTAQLDAGGGAGGYSFTVTSGTMPRGLVLDSSDGVITGTPQQAGTFALQIALSAGGGASTSSALRIVVRPQVGFVTTSLPRARVGKRYVGRIVFRGGVAPVTLSSTSAFPPGVALNAETGVLSGTPRKAGTYRMVVTVSDSFGGSSLRRFAIVVTR